VMKWKNKMKRPALLSVLTRRHERRVEVAAPWLGSPLFSVVVRAMAGGVAQGSETRQTVREQSVCLALGYRGARRYGIERKEEQDF
jgi:hypothetical protein